MKILVLTSRYTATRDIIDEDFGRQTRLFSSLKKLGHDIDFLCADYRKFERRNLLLNGINVMIRPFGFFYFLYFLRLFNKLLKTKDYDVVISTSDPLWGVFGYYFTKKNNVNFIYDLHDNYESYGMYKIPFFWALDRHITKNSPIITTVSNSLKKKISNYRKKNVFVIQNGFDETKFISLDKNKSRNEFGFLKGDKLIVYTGTLQKAQGIHILIKAFRILQKDIPELKLVLAGRFFGKQRREIDIQHKGIIYLGSISQEKIPLLLNSADVLVVPNTRNNFSKYCFPYKVVEYMGCNVPIVATDVGDVGDLLRSFQSSLCKSNNSLDMALKIKTQINEKKVKYRSYAMDNTWDKIAEDLNEVLTSI